MWSTWSRNLRRLALFAGLLGLAACGFQPMYAGGRDSGVRPEMQQVRVQPIGDRVGQQLHNDLRDRLNPMGQPGDPAYDLRVSLSERTEEQALRRDETATRARLTLQASFQLVDRGNGSVLLAGRSRAVNSYNILNSPYATLVAQRGARERGVRELAADIQARVASFLAGRDG